MLLFAAGCPVASLPDAEAPLEDASPPGEDAEAFLPDAALEDAEASLPDASMSLEAVAWVDSEASWGRPCTEADPCSSVIEALEVPGVTGIRVRGQIYGPIGRPWSRSRIAILAAPGGRVRVGSGGSPCIYRSLEVPVSDVRLEGLDCVGGGPDVPCIDWRGPRSSGLIIRHVTCSGYGSLLEASGVDGVEVEGLSDVTPGLDAGAPRDASTASDGGRDAGRDAAPEDTGEAPPPPVDSGADRPYSPRLVEPPLPPLGGDR
jgi:hypothetical protein